jgi:hypothetical protein
LDILIHILAFLFVYNIPFVGIPISSSKIVVIILLLYTIFHRIVYYKKEWFKIVAFLIILILYSIFIMIINESKDMSILYALILFIVNHFLGAFLFVQLLKRTNKLNKNYIIRLFIILAFVQALFILLMLLFSGFREICFSITSIERESLLKRYNGIRGLGMASSVTYDLGVIQSFALIFIIYKMISNKLSRKQIYFYITAYIAIFISVCVTGRTGFIGVLFSIFLSVSYISNDRKKEKNKILRIITHGGLIVILSIIIAFSFLGKDKVLKISHNISVYAFEMIYSYEETGSFSIGTSKNLIKMVENFSNISPKSFLIGDGRYKGEGILYYKHTDIGFFRQIYFFGIVGTLLIVYMYLYIFKRMSITVANDKYFKKVIFLIGIYYFISNIKGDFLIGCGNAISILLILYFTITAENIKDISKRECFTNENFIN